MIPLFVLFFIVSLLNSCRDKVVDFNYTFKSFSSLAFLRVLSFFPRFISFSAFNHFSASYPFFRVLSFFPRFILFHVLSLFLHFIPFSAFYHFFCILSLFPLHNFGIPDPRFITTRKATDAAEKLCAASAANNGNLACICQRGSFKGGAM